MRNASLIDLSSCRKAKKGRRFAVLLIDYVIALIFSFSVFAFAAQPIYENMSSTKENLSLYKEKQDEVLDIIEQTGLQKRNSDNSLQSVSTGAEKWVMSLLVESYLSNGEDFYEIDQGKKVVKNVAGEDRLEDRLYYQKDGDYINDPILHYYFGFRKNNKENYDVEIVEYSVDDIVSNLYLKQGVAIESYIDSSSSYLLLNLDSREKLWDYEYNGGKAGKTVYDSFVSLYKSLINNAVDEFEKSYVPYKNAFAEYTVPYTSYARGFCIALLVSFVIGFALAYIPFEIIFKAGRSIGYRVFSLASIRTDMMDIKFWNVLVKNVVMFILHISSIFFMVLMLGKIQLLSCSLVGPITLFQLILFSLLLDVVSIVFFFISKDNQTLSEFASLTMTVNTKDREEYFYEVKEKEKRND